jgi:hypothetical protein
MNRTTPRVATVSVNRLARAAELLLAADSIRLEG